ncbi:lipopolysaccharide biosynthesis protein [Dietzia cercidiphylli]|uniref:lipopolysaccharide biosynthesis protein n=1 Tax=Dietzia cercidiphylli TaxID=498199 RepID=UPI0015FD2D87|nr:hypothetical protein [Dietzia cercidiphylli]MBB1048172.1 hypothetical protein [Dietzia cercidiphylli]
MRGDTFRATVIRFIAIGLGVLASVLMARLGGAETKGSFSSIVAAGNLLFAVINCELASEVVRHGKKSGSQERSAYWMAPYWVAYCVSGAVLFVLLHPLLPFLAYVVAAACAITVLNQAGVIMNGRYGPMRFAVLVLVQQASVLLITIVLGLLGGLNEGTTVIIVVGSMLTGVALSIPTLFRVGESSQVARPKAYKSILRGAHWVPNRVSQMALSRADLLVVYLIVGPAGAGIYSVGISFNILIEIAPSQYSWRAQYLAANGMAHSVPRMVRKALFLGLVCAGLVGLVGYPLIVLMYGREFEPSYPVLLASLVGAAALPPYQTFCNSIRITGSHRIPTATGALGVAVMLACIVPLTSLFGLVGAAVASSLGCFCALASMAVAYRIYIR